MTDLTEQQIRILRLVAQGRTDQQIGKELWINANTVKTHLRRTYQRLGATGRAHAVYLAMQKGLIS